MKRILFAIVSALLVLTAPLPAFAQDAGDPYAAAAQYRYDQPRTALAAIETQIHSATPAQMRAIEAKLIVILQAPQASSDAKAWVCRQLRQAGSEAAMPALVPLLGDQNLAAPALFALRCIPGAKVDGALRAALPKATGLAQAGIAQTLGARRDAQAVTLLAPLTRSADAAVAEAALYALGQIGGPDALNAVQDAKVPAALERYRQHALLCGAQSVLAAGNADQAFAVCQQLYAPANDPTIRIAALRFMTLADKTKAAPELAAALQSSDAKLRPAAARIACEVGDPRQVLGQLAQGLGGLAPDVRVLLLSLWQDPAVLPLALPALRSDDDTERAAAAAALGRLGGAAPVPALLDAAAQGGATQTAARQALRTLRGADVDPALASAASQGAPARRAEALNALAGRGAMSSVPLFLQAAADADPAVRAAALAGLAALGDARVLPDLLKLLAAAPADDQRAAVQAALIAVGQRSADKEAAAATIAGPLAGAALPTRIALLRTLARLPAAKSLAALQATAGDADAAVQDVALRGLADWPDAAALPDLLRLAKTAGNAAHRILALRGAIRLAALPDAAPATAKAKALTEALALATRPDEKKLVLAALADVKDPAALDLAVTCLADSALEVEAATTVVKLAGKLRAAQPAAAAAAVKKILEVCQSPAARRLADAAGVLTGELENIAPQGIATSPTGLKGDGQSSGPQAAIDGTPATYWDEEDNQKLYRLVVTFKQPQKVTAISVTGYEHHRYAPRDFEVLADGQVIKTVRGAQYDENFLVVNFDEAAARTLELRITGYYGGSPAIRELGIYRRKQP